MNLIDFLNIMEYYAPIELANNFDKQKIGLVLNLLKYKNNSISKIGVCLDVTKNILNRANNDCIDLLLCHHNPFYNLKYKITDDISDCLKLLFNSNISLYCAHTNYDNSKNGMNYAFSKMLNLKNLIFYGGLFIGETECSNTNEFVKYISHSLNIKHFSYIGDNLIKKVLICCGSGFSIENLQIAK